MMVKNILIGIGVGLLMVSCQATYLDATSLKNKQDIAVEVDSTRFVNLKNYSADFVLEMKYATTDNFLKQKVYPCEACFLQVKTVKNLIAASNEFKTLGYKIKIYDCYRPKAIQKKMWKIVSNPIYVANPKKGSIHNRGGAVDLTLVDSLGNELDMGTKFDYFGEEASHNYQNLSDTILKNRQLLKEVMLKHQFKAFDSEWWHYNLKGTGTDKIYNLKWRCP